MHKAGSTLGLAHDTDGLALALAGAGIGGGALTANGQPFAVANAPVTVDRPQTLEVALQFATQVTFDHDIRGVDRLTDGAQLIFSELTSAQVRVDTRLLQQTPGGHRADAVNVRERRFDALFVGNFYSEKSGHGNE